MRAGSLRFTAPRGDLLGAHMSTKGGLVTSFGRARIISANSIAIFTKNSSQWKAKPLTDEDCAVFRAAHAASGVEPLFAHASYLINLAAANEEFYAKSIVAMVDELVRAERLGVLAVVLHPGAHVGRGGEQALDQIARSLDTIHAQIPDCPTITLLETSAGQGSCVGCTFEELATILRTIDAPDRVGICIDTCHIFSAGYDIRSADGYERIIDEIDRVAGLHNIGLFHLNDSKKGLGSRVDRHEHIGDGTIGLEAFARILNDERFAGIPKLLETPKPTEFEADIRNLATLRSLLST